jgi:hypothetical protein
MPRRKEQKASMRRGPGMGWAPACACCVRLLAGSGGGCVAGTGGRVAAVSRVAGGFVSARGRGGAAAEWRRAAPAPRVLLMSLLRGGGAAASRMGRERGVEKTPAGRGGLCGGTVGEKYKDGRGGCAPARPRLLLLLRGTTRCTQSKVSALSTHSSWRPQCPGCRCAWWA